MLLFLLKYSVKIIQKEPCEFVLLSGIANVGPIFVQVYMKTFSAHVTAPEVHLRRVSQSPLFRYLSNVRGTQRQACIFLFEFTTWFSQEKRHLAHFFILLSVCEETKQHEFFSVWKREKHPAKVLCLTVRITNTQLCNTADCFKFSQTGNLSPYCQQLVTVIDPELPVLQLFSSHTVAL